MAKFKFSISIGYVGSEAKEIIEIDDEELEDMTEDEIDDYVYENYYRDWLANNCDMSFYKIE